MATSTSPSEERESTVCFLNGAIEALNLATEISSAAPATGVFVSTTVLLGMIKDLVVDERGYVELGLSSADVCKALERGLEGRRVNEHSGSTLGAIEKLTTTVINIQKKIIEQGKRNQFSRFFHAIGDRGAITAWKQDLHGILLTFNTELSMDNYMALLGLYHKALAGQELAVNQQQSTTPSTPHEELPPPTACFGRDDLIEEVVSIARGLSPVALIGAGGTGKTSIALAVLHHDRIRDRFGDNRHFICCNQFPPSRTNFLNKLFKALGVGVDNPEDLTPLRPSQSSKKVFLILDGVESIIDREGACGRDVYALVEELSLFWNVALVITSSIATIPPDCMLLEVRALMIDDARRTFHRIYDNVEEPEVIDNILRHLDFRPFSLTLAATVANQNNWDNSLLAREWEQCRTDMRSTGRNTSLTAAIELSLTSPTFGKLGPNARGLLEVVAFFPQGIDEGKLEWLFPTIPNRNMIFDGFFAHSLVYRTQNGFITMLTPLRDHLRLKDPMQSPLLCAVKTLYFTRLSVDVDPDYLGFDDSRWITSEDYNVEHLLDVFTSIDSNSDAVWKACAYFMGHLYWHKPRQVVLGSKIERLPDGNLSKPQCLFQLSRLFQSVGNPAEGKELISSALKLYRERGNDNRVASALSVLSDTNRMLHRYEEGIKQAREALEIMERIKNTVGQAECLIALAQLLYEDKQLNAAEEAASLAINLVPGKSTEFLLCRSHRLLGDICHSNGDREKAVHQYKEAIRIASPPGWSTQLFWAQLSLAQLFCEEEERLNDAHAHIDQAKVHATGNVYLLGRAAEMHGRIWHRQSRFEDAISETSRAIENFTKAGLAEDVGRCKTFLRDVEDAANPERACLPLYNH